jgi:NifU-like protein involved in Fe-S cluster formation
VSANAANRNERAGAKLYTPRLLALSASLADYPLDDALPLHGQARSRTCGSTIELGLAADHTGRVEKVGMQVSACAVGQSSAAIMAQGIGGRFSADVEEALAAIEAWLAGEGALPDWPGFDALAPAQAHPGRHDALLMPWRAAREALSPTGSSG